MRNATRLLTLLLMLPLCSCQYFTYYKTHLYSPARYGTNGPYATCAAMGGMVGDSSLDWCVAREERARSL